MANKTSLESGSPKLRRESGPDNINVAQPAVRTRVNNNPDRETDQRIPELELKVAE
jgi:hypothetical protein